MMSKNPLKLKIAYLYPDFLHSFCDKANLDVIKFRAQERNIKIEIEEIKNDDKINSSSYDFYYMSGSNIEALEVCNLHLKNNYSQLKTAAEALVPMLAINCGYILFGKNFQLANSPLYDGLGILDIETNIHGIAKLSKIKASCNLINDTIAGYIQCYSDTKLNESAKPFLTSDKEDTEGAIYKNVIGTYITSPILAHNPLLCDYIIEKCLQTKYNCTIPLAKLTDDIEWYSHNYLLEGK